MTTKSCGKKFRSIEYQALQHSALHLHWCQAVGRKLPVEWFPARSATRLCTSTMARDGARVNNRTAKTIAVSFHLFSIKCLKNPAQLLRCQNRSTRSLAIRWILYKKNGASRYLQASIKMPWIRKPSALLRKAAKPCFVKEEHTQSGNRKRWQMVPFRMTCV